MATIVTGAISPDASSHATCTQRRYSERGQLLAGETLAVGAFVYIDRVHPCVYRCRPTTMAEVHGVVMAPSVAGQPVTVYGVGFRFTYALPGTLEPGALYYLSGTTAGALDSRPSPADAFGVARATSDTDLEIVRDRAQ